VLLWRDRLAQTRGRFYSRRAGAVSNALREACAKPRRCGPGACARARVEGLFRIPSRLVFADSVAPRPITSRAKRAQRSFC
jgi:hypothetical protein